MISLEKAKHTLERWLMGRDATPSTPASSRIAEEQPIPDQSQSYEERVRHFMEELEASSQDWLGKVRLINLESVRKHMGPVWEKLHGKVELLAEKVIRNEMSGRDKLLVMDGGEFLVFFAEATPEESRVRCLAIVETIHEKLFGSLAHDDDPLRKVAGCHVIHRDDLALEWEAERHAGDRDQPTAEGFRRDAEVLDSDDVAASTQIALDSIIARSTQSASMKDLTPLLVRLRYLARSLKTLEPALIAARNKTIQRNEGHGESAEPYVMPLSLVWDDIVGLISVLDAGPGCSHADLLKALGSLQQARLNRARKAVADVADDDLSASRFKMEKAGVVQFEYVPVYRSISGGEFIHRGIYRVEKAAGGAEAARPDDEAIGLSQQEALTLEELALEHAIRVLSDQRLGARFMLMVPVSVETLHGPKSQRRISMILRTAQLRAKRRLLIEVFGYRDSDDSIGIQRAIDELRLNSHAVFVTLSNKNGSRLEKVAAGCKRQGIHAVGIDLSHSKAPEVDTMAAMARFSVAGQQVPIATYIGGIASIPILAKAIGSGISYVCAPALRPPLQAPDEPDRATLDDLYAAI